MYTKKFYSSQLIVLISSIIEIIAVFLPAATVFGTSVNLATPGGKAGAGVLLIILAAISILFALLKKKLIVLIASALSVALAFYQYSSIKGLSFKVSIEAGMYLTIIAAVGILVGAIFMFIQVRKAK